MLANIEVHEHTRMPAEALLQEGLRTLSRVMRQQLRLHAMNARRLLQGFDDVGEQPFLDLVAARIAASVAHRVADRVADIFAAKEVADHALALLVHKEGVAEDAAPLDGGVPRE